MGINNSSCSAWQGQQKNKKTMAKIHNLLKFLVTISVKIPFKIRLRFFEIAAPVLFLLTQEIPLP